MLLLAAPTLQVCAATPRSASGPTARR